MPDSFKVLHASWPAPANVKAFTTLRSGGVSPGPYASLNLGIKGGDDLKNVRQNRAILKDKAGLPESPRWLTQVHGNRVAILEELQDLKDLNDWEDVKKMVIEADASATFSPNKVCAVLTADCLPIFFCDTLGTRVAAVHAGWKGIKAGIIESTVLALQTPPRDLLVWMGPAIGPQAFEVRADMKNQFTLPEDEAAFTVSKKETADSEDRYLANIYLLAKNRLKKLDINNIFGGDFCTYQDSTRFFSYRRATHSKLDPNNPQVQTGHMASVIWFS